MDLAHPVQFRPGSKERLAASLIAILAALALVVFVGRTFEGQERLLFWSLSTIIFVAEFSPIQLFAGSITVTFSLPVISAVAVTFGWQFAIVADCAALLGAQCIMNLNSRQPRALTALNVLVAILAGFLAGSVVRVAPLFGVSVHSVWLVFPYIIVHGFGSGAFSYWFRQIIFEESPPIYFRELLEVAGTGFLFLGLYAFSMGLIAETEPFWLIFIMVIPLFSLRQALRYRAQVAENVYETITALTLMLQRAHPYTHEHLGRVAKSAEKVAKLLGLSERRARLVRFAAVLHDIGKIAVDERILDKPGKLSQDEFDHVKNHAVWGAEIVMPVERFHEISTWIRHHHERVDGGGYPDGLTNREIPIESKIIAVVDAYDAMVGTEEVPGRTYRKPRTHTEAIVELERCSGTQFDPNVVHAFKQVMEN